MNIFVNRTLNFKKIKAVGLDMDYTLIRYHLENFEQQTYWQIIDKLINQKGYSRDIKKLKFDPQWAIRGLVIDKQRGNLLKLNLFGRIKSCSHGLHFLDHQKQKELYRSSYIELSDPNFDTVDTAFSMAYCYLYAQLVELLDSGKLKGKSPLDYLTLARDLEEMLDLSHRDNSLKSIVKKDLAQYIVKDPQTVKVLERFKAYGKSLLLITNSDYDYCKSLLDFAISPYLTKSSHWGELFDYVITSSSKPRFFTEKSKFLKIHSDTGLMENTFGHIGPGIYQGGNAQDLEEYLGVNGDEILYLGDHIYGDIVSLKKNCQWRTALVVEEISNERDVFFKNSNIQKEIDVLMEQKQQLEHKINQLYDHGQDTEDYFKKIENIDDKLSKHIQNYNQSFNNTWGPTMRAGQEQSRFAGQVEKYACIYMSKISDFIDYTPRTYFRPHRRDLPHEMGPT